MPWRCGACTFLNCDILPQCEVCGAPAGPPELPPEGAIAEGPLEPETEPELFKRSISFYIGAGASARVEQVAERDEDSPRGALLQRTGSLEIAEAAGPGISRGQARRAIDHCGGNLDLALAQLLQGPWGGAEPMASLVSVRSGILADIALAEALHAEEENRAAQQEHAECQLPMKAARVCEALRTAAGQAGIPAECNIANYDLCLRWLGKLEQILLVNRNRASVIVVYHGAGSEHAVMGIIDSNLRVPDGVSVLHTTDIGYYGRGIYTSPEFNLAAGYGQGVPFMCLALPGRQFAAYYPEHHGAPLQTGFDSHYSPDGRELVFFNSDQLLPCFRVNATTLNGAKREIATVIELICSKMENLDWSYRLGCREVRCTAGLSRFSRENATRRTKRERKRKDKATKPRFKKKR